MLLSTVSKSAMVSPFLERCIGRAAFLAWRGIRVGAAPASRDGSDEHQDGNNEGDQKSKAWRSWVVSRLEGGDEEKRRSDIAADSSATEPAENMGREQDAASTARTGTNATAASRQAESAPGSGTSEPRQQASRVLQMLQEKARTQPGRAEASAPNQGQAARSMARPNSNRSRLQGTPHPQEGSRSPYMLMQDAVEDLADPQIGCGELGRLELEGSASLQSMRVLGLKAPMEGEELRLDPRSTFTGTYKPADLNPFLKSSKSTSRRAVQGPRFPPPQLLKAQARFTNMSLLSGALTRGGKLQHRGSTALKAGLHRRLMRHVKTARRMGLLPLSGSIGDPLDPIAYVRDTQIAQEYEEDEELMPLSYGSSTA